MERVGPADKAGAAVEPCVLVGAWDGVGGGPALLLLAVDRPPRLAVLVHGRRLRSGGDGAADVLGRRAPLPSLLAVSACLRVQRVAGCWVWEARVGRTRRR